MQDCKDDLEYRGEICDEKSMATLPNNIRPQKCMNKKGI